MKKFRCAREFIEQYLTNNLNETSFELFATGIWDNEYPEAEKSKIYREYLGKLSQLGKRGKNKIFDIDNLCMKLLEKNSPEGSIFYIKLYEYDTKDINLIFIFFKEHIKILNNKTSLPFKEKTFNSWEEVKELFA